MTNLNSPARFLLYALKQALRHPRTPITYVYCPSCKLRLPANAKECPVCHDKVENSPDIKQESPIPWWGSVILIVLGIGTWIASAALNISELGEVGRALVYIPLGSLFGMSLHR